MNRKTLNKMADRAKADWDAGLCTPMDDAFFEEMGRDRGWWHEAKAHIRDRWGRVKACPRNIVFRVKHGFWPFEYWEFRTACARWILPRLRYLRDNRCGSPVWFEGESDEENCTARYDDVLNRIIGGFDVLAGNDPDLDDDKAVDEPLRLFAVYYKSFWD